MITTGATIILRFSSFSTESGYDFVEVYDGSSTWGTRLARLSGTSIPGTQTATSGSMFVRFTSDSGSSGSGVSMSWTFGACVTAPLYEPFSKPFVVLAAWSVRVCLAACNTSAAQRSACNTRRVARNVKHTRFDARAACSAHYATCCVYIHMHIYGFFYTLLELDHSMRIVCSYSLSDGLSYALSDALSYALSDT